MEFIKEYRYFIISNAAVVEKLKADFQVFLKLQNDLVTKTREELKAKGVDVQDFAFGYNSHNYAYISGIVSDKPREGWRNLAKLKDDRLVLYPRKINRESKELVKYFDKLKEQRIPLPGHTLLTDNGLYTEINQFDARNLYTLKSVIFHIKEPEAMLIRIPREKPLADETWLQKNAKELTPGQYLDEWDDKKGYFI